MPQSSPLTRTSLTSRKNEGDKNDDQKILPGAVQLEVATAQTALAAIPCARIEGSPHPGQMAMLSYGSAAAVERLRIVNRISAETANPRNI